MAIEQWARLSCLVVCSSKTKICQFSSIQLGYVALYAPLLSAE